jgi:hypothetical protein
MDVKQVPVPRCSSTNPLFHNLRFTAHRAGGGRTRSAARRPFEGRNVGRHGVRGGSGNAVDVPGAVAPPSAMLGVWAQADVARRRWLNGPKQ